MCRLAAITSREYFSPMENILALETMKEGHDGSGLGLTLKDLGGYFEKLKGYPILSGICSKKGVYTLDEHMDKLGFKLLHVWAPKVKQMKGVKARDGMELPAMVLGIVVRLAQEHRLLPGEPRQDLICRLNHSAPRCWHDPLSRRRARGGRASACRAGDEPAPRQEKTEQNENRDPPGSAHAACSSRSRKGPMT